MTIPENLSSLRLTELRDLAQSLGLKKISALRKGALIELIQQSHGPSDNQAPAEQRPRDRRMTRNITRRNQRVEEKTENTENTQNTENTENAENNEAAQRVVRSRRRVVRSADNAEQPNQNEENSTEEAAVNNDNKDSAEETVKNENREHPESRSQARRQRRNRARQANRDRQQRNQERREENEERQERQERRENNREERQERQERQERRENNRDERRNPQPEGANPAQNNAEEADNPEDYQDIAGILDIVDNTISFVRTTGYCESATDVFVSPQIVRRLGLRRGDAIQGQVRRRVDNNNRNARNRRHNALVRVTAVNGLEPEEARNRPKFSQLTPLYPNQRLRLETDAKTLTTRVIDLVMPIGKGQRALIVSPPKAGKTTILQDIANAITTNNPECKLMVVLVDERPEEVTDMQRSVKGEVIHSTFDRPPSEHTAVAELAIERAKRLVELGQDVVVLLDSITRLGRAYNNSSPGSGRILSGGVDSNALYPPKRFLGAARNIEDGGSLTIIATAMVETGSAGDTVIFEEFKGTGNAELKLDRRIAERRVFPAVDINPSGTRKDELLLAPEEARIVHKLRRLLSALDNQQAIDLVVKQLKKTKNNAEFLMHIAKTSIEED